MHCLPAESSRQLEGTYSRAGNTKRVIVHAKCVKESVESFSKLRDERGRDVQAESAFFDVLQALNARHSAQCDTRQHRQAQRLQIQLDSFKV